MGTELRADSIGLPTDLVAKHTPAPRDEDEPQSVDFLQALSGKSGASAGAESGALTGAVDMLADISERQAEAALRESEERFRALVNASSQIVWTTNAEGVVVEDSPTWRAFTGQTYEEWRDSGWLDALHPDDRERVSQAWHGAVERKVPIEIDYRVRLVSGEWRWTTARAAPVFAAGGALKGYVGMNTDVTRRKEAERSVQQLAAIVESSNDAIISKDLHGIITSWNPGAERLFGYTAEEAIGRPVTLLIPPERHDEERVILEQLRRGERIDHYETIRRRKDGSLAEISLSVSPIRDSNRKIIGGSKIARDISDRKHAEEELRESEKRLSAELAATQQLQRISVELVHEQDVQCLYSKLVDAAATIMRSDCASMQMLDPERGDKGELRLLAARGFSPQATKFWEWVDADSTCTCGMALRTRERAVAPNVETCDFVAGTQHLVTYLQAGIHAAQSTPLLSRSGRLLGMLSTHWREPHEPSETDLQRFDVLARQAADLIERAQAGMALRESEERFRAIVDQTTAGLAQADLTGRFVLVNERYCEITGYSRDELLRMRMQEITHPEDLPRNLELFRRMTAEGAPFVIEKRYLRKDGSAIWVNNTVSLTRDGSGRPQHVIAISLDATERKQAQEQQRLLLREMNHRIKNLFALAGGVVTLSARSAETPKDLAEAVRERLAALARAHELTLADVSGEKADRPATLPVLVRAIVSPLLVEKERVIINGPEVPISGNAVTSLALLLQEFATNAAKYGALASATGRIEISWCEWKGELLLVWREQGGPSIDGPPESKDEGFGSTLARLTVTGQLGGKISRDWDKEGLTIKLSVPLDCLAIS